MVQEKSSKTKKDRNSNRIFSMLAPMAGYTDAAFRMVCQEMGVNWAVTEMVSADGIVANFENFKGWAKKNGWSLVEAGQELSRIRKNLPRGLGVFPEAKLEKAEKNVSIQLFGKEPDILAGAASIVMQVFEPDGIDINMGCPAKKVFRHGRGCALMETPKLAVKIVKAVRKAVDQYNEKSGRGVLFSVKTRLGVENENELEGYVEDLFTSGIDFITVHARNYRDFFMGEARLEALARVVERVREGFGGEGEKVGLGVVQEGFVEGRSKRLGKEIRIVGNGNVVDLKSAKKMVEVTGCDGVAVARGAIGNPWIFKSLAEGKEYIPTFEERIQTALKHAELTWELEGSQGIMEFRKHLGSYFKGIPGIKKHRPKLVRVESLDGVKDALNQLAKKYE